MTYYVLDGNWTSLVASEIGTNNESYLFPINTTITDPAVGCNKKTFYASYQCGNDKKVKNIPSILEAVGQSALFDCSDLNKKCNGLTLNLGDDGILTIQDTAGAKLWDSTKAKNYAALPIEKLLALDAYKPVLNDGTNNLDPDMFANRSYLNAGEFLEPGQYIGSPSGSCRLEMIGSETNGDGKWITENPPYTTTRDNVLTRFVWPKGNNQNYNYYYIILIPQKGTVIPQVLNSRFTLQVATATKAPWITIGNDKDYAIVLNWPRKSQTYKMRYGNDGRYIKKNYENSMAFALFPLGPSEFATFQKIANEGESATVENNTIVRYGARDRWVTKVMSGTVTANNATFGDPIMGVRKELQKNISAIPSGTDEKPNKVQIQMFDAAPSGSALQVVFNTVGCNDEIPITSLNNESSNMYTIPKIQREGLGKMGYVNEYGQLKPYTDPSMIADYSAYFKGLSNTDGSTYGMYGNNLGSPVNVSSKEECKQLCTEYGSTASSTAQKVNCVGFQYESVGKICQLKSEGITTGGIRISNPSDGSVNYQYYSRIKNINGLDASCPSKAQDIMIGSPADWTGFTLADPIVKTTYNANGSVNTQGSRCGLPNAVGSQRKAVAEADLSLNTFKGQLSGTITNLYNKYQSLKNILTNNQTNLDVSLQELNETKQNIGDWSGEQSAQLDAMNEDRELNKQSQNYKHIMWSILAIIAIFVIIKFTKYLGGTSSASSASSKTAVPSVEASTSTASAAASSTAAK